jgi:hypothetical protein
MRAVDTAVRPREYGGGLPRSHPRPRAEGRAFVFVKWFG